jgi:hypothetical protein
MPETLLFKRGSDLTRTEVEDTIAYLGCGTTTVRPLGEGACLVTRSTGLPRLSSEVVAEVADA